MARILVDTLLVYVKLFLYAYIPADFSCRTDMKCSIFLLQLFFKIVIKIIAYSTRVGIEVRLNILVIR